jgi:hypothetical protein
MVGCIMRTFRPARFSGRVCARKVAAHGLSREVSKAMAAAAVAAVLAAAPAYAELNKSEAAAGGEFGMGSAQQFGEATAKNQDFSNQVCH